MGDSLVAVNRGITYYEASKCRARINRRERGNGGGAALVKHW